jgi:FMN-dependent oxidoreductase (nitrilotriacetate monooxygenase family)
MFHLGWFLGGGYSAQAWAAHTPFSGSNRHDWVTGELFVDLAASLERAGFDYLLVEDTLMVDDTYGGSMEMTLKHAKLAPKNDPIPLIPLMAQRTKHIGLAVTMSTSFYHPYMAARTMTTLDHLTEGRVGVNVVTSISHRSAQQFGWDALPQHAERYQMAHEWMEAVGALWESWEPGAVLADADEPRYADHTKVHTVDFEGKYFKTRGPLNTIPGPQRRPVIVQAGASPPGRDLAARFAESMLAHGTSIEQMKTFREDMHARMKTYGRDPSELKILFLIDPVLGESDAAARLRDEEMKAAMYSPAHIEEAMWGVTYATGGDHDFGTDDLDAPVEDIVGNGETSTLRTFIEASQGMTLREAIVKFRMHSGLAFVGSPDTVAAQMGEAMEEVGGDGFLLSPEVTRRNIAEIADGLAPALRKRGLIRDGFENTTFRENLLAF